MDKPDIKLPEYWHVLAVLYFSKGRKVQGSVLFQKILSKLELNAFPLPKSVTFQSGQFGGMYPGLDHDLNLCEDEGLIVHTSAQTGLQNPREDFTLTKEGTEIMERFILPCLETNNGLKARLPKFKKLINEISSMSSSGASKTEHAELLLDIDDQRMRKNIDELYAGILKHFNIWNKFVDDTPLDTVFDMLGTLQLAYRALYIIKKRYYACDESTSVWRGIDNTMSRYYVRKQIEWLYKYLESIPIPKGVYTNQNERQRFINSVDIRNINELYEILSYLTQKYEIMESVFNLSYDIRMYLTDEETKLLQSIPTQNLS